MQCPSCKQRQPMSFQCRSCGAPLMKRPGAAPRRATASASAAAVPSVATASGGSAGAAVIENPYAAPQAFSRPPLSHRGDTETLADRGTRFGAAVLDNFLYFLAMLPGVLLAVFLDLPETNPLWFAMVLGGPFLLLVYNARLLGVEGQTVGKRLTKIRIVDYHDGGNPGYGRAFWIRYVLNAVLAYVPGYGLVDALFIFGAEKRCLHDLIAGTKVVQA